VQKLEAGATSTPSSLHTVAQNTVGHQLPQAFCVCGCFPARTNPSVTVQGPMGTDGLSSVDGMPLPTGAHSGTSRAAAVSGVDML
jgi:hypothetical protein